MSKYIIELDDRIKLVTSVGVTENGVVYTTSDYVHNLGELNSDYINEHYGELQDEAYQRGLEDGKWKAEDGCDGCKYYEDTSLTNPCSECSRGHVDHYKPLSDPDRIEVGDEVEWDNDFTGDRFIVTRIYQPYGKKEQCDGIDDDGDVYRAVLIESLVKTGRHFDIQKILEDMRHD